MTVARPRGDAGYFTGFRHMHAIVSDVSNGSPGVFVTAILFSLGR